MLNEGKKKVFKPIFWFIWISTSLITCILQWAYLEFKLLFKIKCDITNHFFKTFRGESIFTIKNTHVALLEVTLSD